MALIICLSSVLLVACVGNENNEQTETDTNVSTEVVTDAPDTGAVEDTDDTDAPDTDDVTVETDGEVEVGEIDSSKDAYADDIYSGVTPEVIG